MSDDIFNSSDEFFRELEGIYGQGPEFEGDAEADKMLEGLNPEQRAAVTHLDGPLLRGYYYALYTRQFTEELMSGATV